MISNFVSTLQVFFISLIISNCAYEYNKKKTYENKNFVTIPLNVLDLELKKSYLKITNPTTLIDKRFKQELSNSFEEWAVKKFQVNGLKNKAYINIEKINSKLMQKKTVKKLKYFFLKTNKSIYSLNIDFNIIFIDENSTKKKLKILSKINLTLFDNYSITKRNRALELSIKKLIRSIDNKVNTELNNKLFRDFIIKKVSS